MNDFRKVGGPGEVALGWWLVDNVFTDPCHWKDSLAYPPVGPSVDDLAAAFAAQVGRDELDSYHEDSADSRPRNNSSSGSPPTSM